MRGPAPTIRVRQWLLIVIFLISTAVVASRFTDLRDLILTLSKGEVLWIIIGVTTHLAFIVLYALLYKIGFQIVGVSSRLIEMVPLVFVSIFINAIPTGGAASAAIFIDDAIQRGQSGARTAVGLVLVLLADLGTLIPFILVGLFTLLARNYLTAYEVIGVLMLIFFIIILVGSILLARWRQDSLRQVLAWFRSIVNNISRRVNRPEPLAIDWPDKNVIEFSEAAMAIATHPAGVAGALGLGIVLHFVNIAGLYAFFIAYRQPANFGIVVAGYGMGIVFWIITIIPQGTGIVEGIMSLVFISLGIPKLDSIVIATAFRGVNFWLPVVVGFYYFRKLRTFGASPSEETAGEPLEHNH